MIEPETRQNVALKRGAPALGYDAIFLPTDRNGSFGGLKIQVLNDLGLSPSLIPKAGSLGAGYYVVELERLLICFIVTVGHGPVDEALQLNLLSCLNDNRVIQSKTLWLPLMGTGAGNLSNEQSLRCILVAIEKANRGKQDWTITLSAPPAISESEFAKLEQIVTASIRLGANQVETMPSLEAESLFGEEAVAIISLARALGKGRRETDNAISVRRLMFALAESNNPIAPEQLRRSRAAVAFAKALHALAGDNYVNAWQTYFMADFSLEETANSTPNDQPEILARNLQNVLSTAHQMSGKHQIGVDKIVTALLESSDGEYNETLLLMHVAPADLVLKYRQALSDELSDSIGFRARMVGVITSDTVDKLDRLDFKRYADAIAKFINNPNTSGPIAISIQAPWGGGKSTLMNMVRELLDPKEKRPSAETPATESITVGQLEKEAQQENAPTIVSSVVTPTSTSTPCLTIWFNAWKYESSNQLWAGLVDAIIRGVADKAPPGLMREQFYVRLNSRRINAEKVRWIIAERAWNIWLRGSGALITIIATALGAAFSSEAPALLAPLHRTLPFNAHAPLSSVVGGSVAALVACFATRKRDETTARAEPAATTKLAEFINVPNYAGEVGFIHQVEKDLQIVLKASGGQNLVVFVDDLDRCSPSSVALVMAGLNLFLAGDFKQCYFLIGMDAELVAAALDVAHADVISKIPSDARVPLGWRFMDKFITLPFVIPPSSPKTIEAFLDGFYVQSESVAAPKTERINGTASGNGTSDERATSSPDGPGTTQSPRSEPPRPTEFDESSRRVQDAIHDALPFIGSNPRDIKRFLNALRLNATISNISTKNGASDSGLLFPQIVTWTILSIRWPEVARWLRRGSVPSSGTGEQYARTGDRLLLLADISGGCVDVSTWQINAKSKGLDKEELRWLGDPALLRLLTFDSQQERHNRLSAGTGKGLW